MILAGEQALPRSVDDMIELFACRVDVWQLGPAVALLHLMEKQRSDQTSIWAHSAYVLLGAIVTYFEMLGKTLNPSSKTTNTAGADFNYGFCDVYPDFVPSSKCDFKDASLPDVKEFRDRARNGLYHLGYTKRGLFLWDEPAHPDFFVDRQTAAPVYRVNPHGATRTLVAHFPVFLQRLRDPSNQEMRQRFELFFTKFHGIT
jgi:hypothetical protein